MKKTIFLFFLVFASLIISQPKKDSLLIKDADKLIEELRFIYELDQSTRKYLEYGTFDKSICDSIESLNTESIKIANKQLSLSQDTKDKIWKSFLSPLDTLKAERMIQIIEKYGFPSFKRIEKLSGKDIDFNPVIILAHTPFSFKDRMIHLLEKEYKAGNFFGKCEYGYLLWHLNGRSDFKYMLENGYEMKTNTDGTFHLTSTCE